MSSYIIPKEQRFDVDRLRADVMKSRRTAKYDQVNVRVVDNMDVDLSLIYGAGSLYDENKKPFTSEREFTSYHPSFEDSYLVEVIEEIKQVMTEYGVQLGRARLLTMAPKSNLTYHVDYGAPYRFHVPIMTNDDVFYVTNDTVDRMPEVGRLYVYRTDVKHTVVNASRVPRVHLVCSGWK